MMRRSLCSLAFMAVVVFLPACHITTGPLFSEPHSPDADSEAWEDADVAAHDAEYFPADAPSPEDSSFDGDVGVPRCEGSLHENVHINGPDDLDVLRSVVVLYGDLTVDFSNPLDLSGALSCLEEVHGNLRITGYPAESAALAALRGFANLEEVWGNLVIGDTRFERIESFGALQRVLGSVQLLLNPKLLSFELPVGEAHGVDIYGNELLHQVSLPRVVEVYGRFKVDDNASLVSAECLELRLIEEGLFIRDNEALSSLVMPSLESLSSSPVEVTNNPHLPTCEIEGLIVQLAAEGSFGETLIEGNDDEASCE